MDQPPFSEINIIQDPEVGLALPGVETFSADHVSLGVFAR
jgi:hypothetical protein